MIPLVNVQVTRMSLMTDVVVALLSVWSRSRSVAFQ